MQPIYLDYAATTPVRREVREVMLPFLGEQRFGNPSSIHRWGREARVAVEEARSRLAAVLRATPAEIVFTRGGTEADNLAILGRARRSREAPVVCSAIEHRAVLGAARTAKLEGNPLHTLPVDSDGVVQADALTPLLEPRPAVVSVMWVNNEVGTIQPIEQLTEMCRGAGVAFHTDAVQALGKVAIRLDRAPIDLLSISAHKIGGPKGVGALFVRRGTSLVPLIHGGSQERGLRAGTEDVAGAVGFALAAELAERERGREMERLRDLRTRLENGLREQVPALTINAAAAERVPTLLNVSVPGADSEALLLTLDLEGIAVSSGSACSSGGVDPSHVLTAMGLAPEVAAPSLRISLGKQTTAEEIDRVVATFPRLIERLRTLAGTG